MVPPPPPSCPAQPSEWLASWVSFGQQERAALLTAAPPSPPRSLQPQAWLSGEPGLRHGCTPPPPHQPPTPLSQLSSEGASRPPNCPTTCWPSTSRAHSCPLRAVRWSQQAPHGTQREAFFLIRPHIDDKGQYHPSMMCRERARHTRETFNLSQELGASYKNGNFLEIQLRVFIVTLGNQGNDFKERVVGWVPGGGSGPAGVWGPGEGRWRVGAGRVQWG